MKQMANVHATEARAAHICNLETQHGRPLEANRLCVSEELRASCRHLWGPVECCSA